MKIREKWMLENKKADYRGLAQHIGVSPLLVKLAVNRGYRTQEELEAYFFGTRDTLPAPQLLKDGQKAAELLLGQLRRGGKIGIASDFDVDGIFSAWILYRVIGRLGGEAVIYTPDRVAEGYGLNMRIVAQAHEEQVGLLITCDNGIAAADPIAYARELGLTVIVTDHHEIPYEEENGQKVYQLPAAHAIVNPKQVDCPYPHKGLCGAGITYKLAQLLYERAQVPSRELDELLTYAAIATVADVMELTGENRILVKYGLHLLKRTPNVGLRVLMDVTGLSGGEISAYHIGYVLGPCFNAAGRLSTVEMAFSLLQSDTMEEALPLALELKRLNDERKDLTTQGVEEAVRQIEDQHLDDYPVIVVYLPGCHESLAGIIAGRIRERYHHPAYVLVDGETGIKGSGRSIEAYSMFEQLQKCRDLLSRFGGHPMAAGLSLKKKEPEAFRQAINQGTGLTREDFRPVVRIDAAVSLAMLSEGSVQELELLEPFGKGNGRPLFADRHFTLLRAEVVGRNRNVLKLLVRDTYGCTMNAMYFGDIPAFDAYVEAEYGKDALQRLYQGGIHTERFTENPTESPTERLIERPTERSTRTLAKRMVSDRSERTEHWEGLDMGLVYYPQINEFRGERQLQITIQHYCRISSQQ